MVRIPLTRKQTAPRNVAAKALRRGQFQPKVEPDPKAYSRKAKHKALPAAPPDDDPASGA